MTMAEEFAVAVLREAAVEVVQTLVVQPLTYARTCSEVLASPGLLPAEHLSVLHEGGPWRLLRSCVRQCGVRALLTGAGWLVASRALSTVVGSAVAAAVKPALDVVLPAQCDADGRVRPARRFARRVASDVCVWVARTAVAAPLHVRFVVAVMRGPQLRLGDSAAVALARHMRNVVPLLGLVLLQVTATHAVTYGGSELLAPLTRKMPKRVRARVYDALLVGSQLVGAPICIVREQYIARHVMYGALTDDDGGGSGGGGGGGSAVAGARSGGGSGGSRASGGLPALGQQYSARRSSYAARSFVSRSRGYEAERGVLSLVCHLRPATVASSTVVQMATTLLFVCRPATVAFVDVCGVGCVRAARRVRALWRRLRGAGRAGDSAPAAATSLDDSVLMHVHDTSRPL